MQPFDLLGITIKSLAEIEKEVSTYAGLATLLTPLESLSFYQGSVLEKVDVRALLREKPVSHF